ncbi:NAD(P)H-binding protein [Noviherbaspirillum sp.]|uniref:NAD(P)H-binding protein n=1 Tax=Noviherbaspirillum sp. TaxID=1926288 RepID=UPI002D6370AB|nr:NAD(P)H-binding protein [Noviherbaspirillum sp.]HZW23257.1 NAD(P)H-binding protein [Noviherbaspirillum sp.]
MDILLAGATGLVGSRCLPRLLDAPDVERVVAPARRQIAVQHPKLERHIIDFTRLGAARCLFNVDKIICTLGTTIRQAGSQERFREVDLAYPLEMARLGREQGVRHFLLVSALGADAESNVFYNRVKGEVELGLRALGYPQLTILRPSLLLGKRGEFRLGEEFGKRLAFLVPGKYRPVQADDVAKVLVEAARQDVPGVEVIESADIRRRAAR